MLADPRTWGFPLGLAVGDSNDLLIQVSADGIAHVGFRSQIADSTSTNLMPVRTT